MLGEERIDRAVKAFPHAESIFETNLRAMERIDHAGWAALEVDARPKRGTLPP